ncbi:MAG: hypothetical protein JWR37_5096 [Mycobacterium sp.]|nr:hypothetical protein [Mycobacterium sp.]
MSAYRERSAGVLRGADCRPYRRNAISCGGFRSHADVEAARPTGTPVLENPSEVLSGAARCAGECAAWRDGGMCQW